MGRVGANATPSWALAHVHQLRREVDAHARRQPEHQARSSNATTRANALPSKSRPDFQHMAAAQQHHHRLTASRLQTSFAHATGSSATARPSSPAKLARSFFFPPAAAAAPDPGCARTPRDSGRSSSTPPARSAPRSPSTARAPWADDAGRLRRRHDGRGRRLQRDVLERVWARPGPSEAAPRKRKVGWLPGAPMRDSRGPILPRGAAAGAARYMGGCGKIPCPGVRTSSGSNRSFASSRKPKAGPYCTRQSAGVNGIDPRGYCVPRARTAAS
jgi:hypothetical protein